MVYDKSISRGEERRGEERRGLKTEIKGKEDNTIAFTSSDICL